MSKALTNPLQDIIKKAATTLPVETGRTAAQKARIDRRRGAVVILADVSHSMSAPAWGQLRKIDVLREAVGDVMDRNPDCTLIVFSREARTVTSIPEPEANTDLVAGLIAAQALDPGVVLLISDGQPDDPAAALRIARAWRGVIDVLYVGPDSDAAAIAFMRDLAGAAAGEVRVNDIGRGGTALQLGHTIAGMLSGPTP